MPVQVLLQSKIKHNLINTLHGNANFQSTGVNTKTKNFL